MRPRTSRLYEEEFNVQDYEPKWNKREKEDESQVHPGSSELYVPIIRKKISKRDLLIGITTAILLLVFLANFYQNQRQRRMESELILSKASQQLKRSILRT